MTLKNLPDDINIEDVLTYLSKESYNLNISGTHKRNSYKDIIGYENVSDGKMEFCIGRHSLYNSLPEYMFHPINRFDNIPEREREEKFKKEIDKQNDEIKNAHRFFSFIDILLLELKAEVKNKVYQYTSSNKVIQEIIGDTLSDKEKNNRFIKRTIPFLPNCKHIRGNRTLITFILRKVLYEENILLNKEVVKCKIIDNRPQYDYMLNNGQIDSMYLGNEFSENVTTYSIRYWSDEECTEHFCQFLEELEIFRLFIKDYFLSVEEELCFHVSADYPPLRLSDNVIHNYLNFNANI